MDTHELLKKVRKLEIKTRALSAQMFSGQYHSTFKGRGMAFSEVREYQAGDEIRTIDWNVTARLGTPYVKVFEEERELQVMLLLDMSGSGSLGSRELSKRELIIEMAAVLAFSAIQNNDKVGAILFTDQVEAYIPPKKGKKHILTIISTLLNFKPESKKTNVSEALRFFDRILKKKSIAMVISDFMDDGFEHTLRITGRKHDVMAIRVYDQLEYKLPDVGMIYLEDAESGTSIPVSTGSSFNHRAYERHMKKHEQELESIFIRSKIDHASFATGQNYIQPLMKLLERHARK